mgnify:CR=1 FL=1
MSNFVHVSIILISSISSAICLVQNEPTNRGAVDSARPDAALDTADPADDTQSADAAPSGSKFTFPFQGEVTGDNVYVRSGAGINWYPTTKLGKGTVVRVIGEVAGGWLRIIPPPGSFSYVDAAAIERTPGSDKGVTRVDGVYVKAGSEVSARKTAVQQVLTKGVEVSILGETEGFLKIAPPEGAYLFISEQFVQPIGPGGAKFAKEATQGAPVRSPPREAAARVADATPPGTMEPIRSPAHQTGASPDYTEVRSTTGSPGSISTAERPAAGSSTATGSGPIVTGSSDSVLVTRSAGRGKYRVMLDAVESDLRAALASSDPKIDYQSLIERFRPIAEQDEDVVSRAVARARVDQLQSRMELERIVADARDRHSSTEAFIQRLGEDRSRITDMRLPPERRFWDLKGELRRSAAFDRAMPNRYRLLDPITQKSVAYIDVPPTSGIDVLSLLNRYVGVRVASQYFSTQAKVTIAVAAEIVPLPSPVASPTPAIEQAGTPLTTGSPPAASPWPGSSVTIRGETAAPRPATTAGAEPAIEIIEAVPVTVR